MNSDHNFKLSDITFKNSSMQSYESKNKQSLRIVKNYVDIDPLFDFQLGYVKLLSSGGRLEEHIHLDSYEIVYMYKGVQYYTIDGEDYYVSSGKMVISPPGVIHTTGYEPENKSSFYYLTINIDALPDVLVTDEKESEAVRKEISKLATNKNRVFDITVPKEMERLLKKLIDLHKSKDTDCFIRTHIRNTVSEIILMTLESAREKTHTLSADTMDDVIEYIDTHIEEKISVETLASIKNFSKSAFQEKFKLYMGIPVYEYVMRRKIDMAMILLEAENIDKKHIWERLSFSSEPYFITVFKKYTGFTPTQYLRDIIMQTGIKR